MDQSANSGQSRAVKKVSLMSLFFNPGRDLHEGLQSLEDAQNLLEEVKARLDPSVKKDFEHRLHGLYEMAKNQDKKDGVLPRTIYANILNPKRFKTASKDYHDALMISAMLIRHETGKHIEDVDDTLFMIDDLEGGTPTAWLAGEVGEAEFLNYFTNGVDMNEDGTNGNSMNEDDMQAMFDAVSQSLRVMRDAADPSTLIHAQTSPRAEALVLE